jgi:hypothetical protein
MALPTIQLPRELSKRLQRGHPWVYRDRLPSEPELDSRFFACQRARCEMDDGTGPPGVGDA